MTAMVMWMAMLGCTPEGGSATAPATGVDATGHRFERVGMVDNPGAGVVPTAVGLGAWLGTSGGLERVDAASGAVDRTIALDGSEVFLLDGDGERWLVQLDDLVAVVDGDGVVTESWPALGEAVAGRLAPSGPVVVVDGELGCERVDLGSVDGIAEPLASCDVGGDLEALEDLAGRRVAMDPSTGRTFVLHPGTTSVDVVEGGVVTRTLGLSRTAVDIAARNGMLVMLSDEQVLAQIDDFDGESIAEVRIFQPDDLARIRLTDDTSGVVLDGSGGVVFYRIDPDGNEWLIPDDPNYGSPPGSGGGGGL